MISNVAWLVIVVNGLTCFLFGFVIGRLTSMSGRWNRRIKKRIQAVKAGIQSMDQEWKLEETSTAKDVQGPYQFPSVNLISRF